MGSSNTLFQGSTKAKIHDYWIVAIGDSFASGEGNPDKSLLEADSAQWISGKLFSFFKKREGYPYT